MLKKTKQILFSFSLIYLTSVINSCVIDLSNVGKSKEDNSNNNFSPVPSESSIFSSIAPTPTSITTNPSSLIPIVISNDPGIINTVAGDGFKDINSGFTGRFNGDNISATKASLNQPSDVAVDAKGNIYIADYGNFRVRKIDNAGTITTIAGGNRRPIGDGTTATSASLNANSIAIDGKGNIYISDFAEEVVRKVDSSGIISTFAGTGTSGFSGDGGPASQAKLNFPGAIALDNNGNLYIPDSGNNKIRKVDTNGIITTIAGGGDTSQLENIQATSASIGNPGSVAVDNSGNVFFTDTGNGRIRKIDSRGIVTTVAGVTGQNNLNDGIPATTASIYFSDIAVDNKGNLFISDYLTNKIRKVDSSGIITTVAGDGFKDVALNGRLSGDGGPAISASLNKPGGIFLDGNNLFIADSYNNVIRKVTFQK